MFVIIMIMSRLLNDSDYGLVGMLTIFIDIAQNLVDCGVSQALIRKQDITDRDCSTAFIFNMGLAVVLYIILFFCSPMIADFYDQPQLTSLTRVISLSIIINAFIMVQRSLLSIKIDFKTQTKASLGAAIVSGIAGITMAFYGLGVWSIVFFQLLNLLVGSLLLWFMESWRPRWEFSMTSFKYFFRFGSNLTVAGIMQTIYRDMYLVIIGKFYGTAPLGLYTRANQISAFPSGNINAILQRVTYPVLCRLQDNPFRLKDAFVRLIRVIAFLVFPMMTGLAVLGEPFVNVMLGKKWEFAGTLLSVLCLSMMWIPVDTMNLNLLQVKGRTDYFLKCEIWKKIFGIGILVVTIPMGLLIMCWGQVIRALIDMVIDTYYTGKHYNLGLIKQIMELVPSMSYCVIMVSAVYGATVAIESDGLKLIVGIPVAIITYYLAARITSSRDLKECISLIKKTRK